MDDVEMLEYGGEEGGINSRQLGLDCIFFLFTWCLLIWPPDALVQLGLNFEDFPRPTHDMPLARVELKVRFNRLYASLPPVAFLLYAIWTYGPQLPLLVLLIFSLAIFQYHGFSLLMSLYNLSKGKFSLAGDFTDDEISDINARSPIKFFIPKSYASVIFLDDRYFIDERRFGYSVERMADLKFTVTDSAINMHGVDMLTGRAENIKTGKIYKFRMQAFKLIGLRRLTRVEMKCAGIHDQFIERFVSYIEGNPKFIMNDIDSLDACFACYAKQPDVIIKSNCIAGRCTPCACRPTWCAACLARIFAAAQPVHRPSRWMDGTASCPTCRATFCPNDVFFVRKEADL